MGHCEENDFSMLNTRRHTFKLLLRTYFGHKMICKIWFFCQAREIAVLTGFGRGKNENYVTVVGGYKIKYNKK